MAESSGRKTGGGGGGGGSTSSHLATTYPVNTIMELKLSDGRPPIRGLIYCTDEISNTIVLKKSLVHTTLSSEITVVNAECVMEYKDITKDIISVNGDGSGGDGGDDNNSNEEEKKALRELAGVSNLNELKLPLPNVSGKVLEERERRAIKLAEESFSHINQKASPEGQKIFDKLLKACNEVEWKGESIRVLKEIRVDPPYKPENCSLIKSDGGGLDVHSLERVKKIVSAASAT